ncbi:MAG TPA: deoxyribonuclease IV [Nitrospirales bacterium]|jgi:deoxyribonuclease-4
MRIGVHVSIAGGLCKAVERAQVLGCRTMQIFSKSPRGWAARLLDPGDVEEARRMREQAEIAPFVVHASYLINLAAIDPALYQRSIEALHGELVRCEMMRADFLVLHVGSAKPGQPEPLARIAHALREVLAGSAWRTRVLLENTAGQRGEVGSRLEELAELLFRVGSDRLGICLDTCHTFAAGYDVRTMTGVKKLIAQLRDTIELPSVQLIHANDSKKGLACRVDRHEHIGKGQIGLSGFRALLAYPEIRRLPIVLETPKTCDADDRRNLKVVRNLAALSGSSSRLIDSRDVALA